MTDFAMKAPCTECPWRRSSQPGKFTVERYLSLADTCKPGGLRTLFACHMTPDDEPRACAGMLAVCGRDSNAVRLAVSRGRFDPDGFSDIDLKAFYASYREMAVANGCDADAEEFEGLPE